MEPADKPQTPEQSADSSSSLDNPSTQGESLEAPATVAPAPAAEPAGDQTSDEQPAAAPEPEPSSEANGEANADAPAAPDAAASSDGTTPDDSADGSPPSSTPPKKTHRLFRRFSVYLLLFVLLVVVGIIITLVAFLKSPKSTPATTIKPQNLSASQLEQLAAGSSTIGNSNQVLNIKANAIFGGQVLIQKDLDVAGNIQVGGALALPNLTVSGTGTFQTLQTSKLAISGNLALQGQLTVNSSLNVAGSANFGGAVTAGQLTVQSLQLSGDLVLTHHIDAGGAAPGHSGGSALGNGGTASVSGSDTAGSVNINTGSSPGAGCFITINFTHSFNATPHIVVTPVGSAAGGLAYYINRSTTNFSICTASPPPAGASFGFDYIAFD